MDKFEKDELRAKLGCGLFVYLGFCVCFIVYSYFDHNNFTSVPGIEPIMIGNQRTYIETSSTVFNSDYYWNRVLFWDIIIALPIYMIFAIVTIVSHIKESRNDKY